jgi:hypothetical protein
MDNLQHDAASNYAAANPMTLDSSVPALLAEEWTIQPYSTLPSFLEVMMIQDAEHAVTRAAKAGMDTIQEQLRLFVLRRRRWQQQQQQQSEPSRSRNNTNRTLTNQWATTVAHSNHNSYSGDEQGSWTKQVATIISQKMRSLFGLQEWTIKLAAILEQILAKYGAEIRCLMRYCLWDGAGQIDQGTTAADG